MGVAIWVIRGDEVQACARVGEVLHFLARSPRHFARLRRTLTIIGVGAPIVPHGAYISRSRSCNLAVRELELDSIPALAATLIHATTEARLRRAVFERRAATVEEWRRLRVVCARASADFLDYMQTLSRSGLTSA